MSKSDRPGDGAANKWISRPVPKHALTDDQARPWDDTLLKLLRYIGCANENEAEDFLHPRLRALDDPFQIAGVEAAVARLKRAIDERETIQIIGDYDVDGITSTTILADALSFLGNQPSYLIPRRIEDGYGLSPEVLNRVFEANTPNLVCVLDSGTNCKEEVQWIQDQGAEVIIIDHHQPKENSEPHAILVNPHLEADSMDSWKNACTAGLVFKCVHGLLKCLRNEGYSRAQALDPKRYLELAALGTVADLVPLVGENRILVKHGLKGLAHTEWPGLKALLQACNISYGQPLEPTDVSFKLAPPLNASGRLADAAVPIDMFLETDSDACLKYAKELVALNRKRQDIERSMVNEAIELAHDQDRHGPVLVLHHPEWHSGIVGIVAGKLSRTFQKPCIVLGQDNHPNQIKGSGRSIPGINLVEALSACAPVLTSWGGHPMAAGVSLEVHALESFRTQLTQAVVEQASNALPETELEISLWLTPDQIDRHLLETLDQLRPYGQKNPQPVLALSHIQLDQRPNAFGRNHLRFPMPRTRYPLQAVAWNMGDQPPPAQTPIDLAFTLNWQYWNGHCSPQAQIIDWRYAE